jgi:S-phase kinase-associated protein 1
MSKPTVSLDEKENVKVESVSTTVVVQSIKSLDDANDEKEYILIPKRDYNGDQTKIRKISNKKILFQSVFIKTIIEGDLNTKELELDVTSEILNKVLEYMTYHDVNGEAKEIEKPLSSANLSEVVSQWDANFVNVVTADSTFNNDALCELVLAANYFDIKHLLELVSAKFASMMKGKTPEQIRTTFNIENDFTPEEEAKIKEENKWAEES